MWVLGLELRSEDLVVGIFIFRVVAGPEFYISTDGGSCWRESDPGGPIKAPHVVLQDELVEGGGGAIGLIDSGDQEYRDQLSLPEGFNVHTDACALL